MQAGKGEGRQAGGGREAGFIKTQPYQISKAKVVEGEGRKSR